MGRDLFPVFLDLADRLVVVVGGGAVATERVAKLAAHGARVRLVSPEASAPLAAMVADGTVAEHHARRYETGDLDGAVLVIAATDDAAVNRRVRDDALVAGAQVNVADDPGGSTAVIPALMRQGDLAVAITTKCEGCMDAHVRKAQAAGATKQEIAEALGVAIALNAGAAFTYALHVLDRANEA